MLLFLAFAAAPAAAQEAEFILDLPASEDFVAPYSLGSEGGGVHSATRSITGPYDLDGDGNVEILATDYSGGGRVHVIENTGVDTWEVVYTTPWQDSTASGQNARYAVGADLDGDGASEIIFLSGRSYSDTNPNIDDRPIGLYVYEFTGTDNDFGAEPASIYDFTDDEVPDRWVSEMLAVADVDNDGVQEILFPNNGGTGNNRFDSWWILSVAGDIGSGFETWVQEVRIASRDEDYDPVNRGGGSAYAVHPADLDGDGNLELSFHSWNSFNFFNGRATGPDTYEFTDGFLQAGAGDHVSLFGGYVTDIDQNGDDEVFYPRWHSGSSGDVSILNYEDGEDVLEVTAEQLKLDLISGLSNFGLTSGDLDRDGNIELIGTGIGYGAAGIRTGSTPTFVRIAEFIGGDPEDASNYLVSDIDYFEPYDTMQVNVDYVISDSAGVITEFYEDTGFSGKNRSDGHPGQGALFATKVLFLGDPDDDGFAELAVSFQGVDDSTYVLRETFNPADSTRSREIVERRGVPARPFVRILEFGADFTIDTDRRAEVPEGYVLEGNYPNPFNPTTTFRFTLPERQRVTVRIYDVMGRVVQTLLYDAAHTPGTYAVTWDGTDASGRAAASGTYFYTLEFGGQRLARPMLLVK